jgi:hypothetical protein
MPVGEGVLVEFYPETRVFYGYDIHNGELLWGPSDPLPDAFSIYTWHARIAYGKLFVPDYGGYLHGFDVHTGELLWSYFLGDAGYDTPYGHYTIETPMIIADGKVYSSAGHGYSPPIFKGATMTCVNETDGRLIWDILFFGCRQGLAAADGYLVSYNVYDGQVYCFGKGPSQTTVNTPLTGVDLGSSVTISGSVTDECAGAKKLVAEGRFKRIPAMSDEDMREWMEYLYMQQPKPADAEGVTVKLYSIDPNSNYQDIGEVTTDIWGNFGISWVPPVSGVYQVVAEFEGSASYGKSSASTYFTVDEAPKAAQAIEPEPAASTSTQYVPTGTQPTQATETSAITTSELAIIAVAAIALIGVVALLAIRKRR